MLYLSFLKFSILYVLSRFLSCQMTIISSRLLLTLELKISPNPFEVSRSSAERRWFLFKEKEVGQHIQNQSAKK